MMSPEFCNNTRKGSILVDIIVALALGAFFVSIIAESSLDANLLYYRAKDRQDLLSTFDAGLAQKTSKPYGNDAIQTDYIVSQASSSLSFTSITPILPNLATSPAQAQGTPLCGVDHATSSVTITVISLPLSSSTPLTDLQVRDGIAYVSADPTVSSDPDLFVIDINDSAHPVVLSSIDTGPGLASIALAGRRIYAAALSTAGQLHIIRMDSPTRLILEKKFKLALPYATATPPLASSIFYNNGYIYLGTEKWDGPELNIIDVSNPTTPVTVGYFETGTKSDGIYVKSPTVYLAGADDKQLRVMNINDPSRPILVNSFTPAGWQRQEGRVVTVFENRLLFGRTSGGYDVSADHEVFAWATTSSTTLAFPSSANIPGGVYGLLADRSSMFTATRQVGKEFQIFAGSILSASSTKTFSLPDSSQAMTCDRNKLYVLAHNAPIIYVITFKE